MDVVFLVVVALLTGSWVWLLWFRKREQRGNEVAVEREQGPAPKPKNKRYPVQIVGTKNYQRVIKTLCEHEPVVLFHEPDNPYDDEAVAVTARGKTIGYLARDNWLREALLDEGKEYTARIARLSTGEKFTGVTIEVVFVGQPLGERAFVRA